MILLYHSMSCVCQGCLSKDEFFDPIFNKAVTIEGMVFGK